MYSMFFKNLTNSSKSEKHLVDFSCTKDYLSP